MNRYPLRVGFVVCAASVLAVVALFTPWPLEDTTPDCPAEDSCTVDYRDGAWHITEDMP